RVERAQARRRERGLLREVDVLIDGGDLAERSELRVGPRIARAAGRDGHRVRGPRTARASASAAACAEYPGGDERRENRLVHCASPLRIVAPRRAVRRVLLFRGLDVPRGSMAPGQSGSSIGPGGFLPGKQLREIARTARLPRETV